MIPALLIAAAAVTVGNAEVQPWLKTAPAATFEPKGDWFVPITVGYREGWFTGIGAGYTFKSGVTLSLQGLAGHVDATELTGTVRTRWYKTVTLREPGETKFGGQFTVTVPIK